MLLHSYISWIRDIQIGLQNETEAEYLSLTYNTT